MQLTDTLNGHTVEDVRRNNDGSVTLFCDSGRTITLHVVEGKIVAKPPQLVLPGLSFEIEVEPSERMRLREAFLGHMIDYAVYDQNGCITFVCQPLRHDREVYKKALGHREITLTHSNGLINELPPVSAIIGLPSQKVFGKAGS